MLLRFSFLAAARWPCLFCGKQHTECHSCNGQRQPTLTMGRRAACISCKPPKRRQVSQPGRQAVRHLYCRTHLAHTHTHAVRRTSCTQKERRATKRRRRKLERQTKHGAVHKTLVPSTSAAAEPATPFPPSLSLSGFSFGYGFGIESGAGRLVLSLLVLVLDFFFCLLLLATSCWLLA